MRTDPFSDSWLFFIGATNDHNALGVAKYAFVVFFLALLAASAWIAWTNWTRDPAQRTAGHLWTWLFRVLIGSMWFQASLWKLPLPVSEGLTYWTQQLGEHAAFEIHKQIVKDIFIPNLAVLNPLVYLAELFFSVSLMLGFMVRISSVLAILFTLHIWLGLYLHPHEWPWLYIFLVMVHGQFAISGAGRSLGLDARMYRDTSATRPDMLARSGEAMS